MLYPYESNYLLYTWSSDINKEAISSYDWAENARKDEVKFQLSLAFPLWRGILGENSLLGASYTQKSWWQLSNSKESAPFRETNYEPQLFLGFATDYQLAGWTLRDVEMGYNHDSNGRSDPTSRSWNRLYARLMAQNGNWLVEVKPWYVVGSTNDNPDITKYMGYYRLKVGYQLGDAILSAQGNITGTAVMAAQSSASAIRSPATCVSTPRSTAVMASRSLIITLTRPGLASV